MRYNILNRRIGSALEMNFKTEESLYSWLEDNQEYDNLGPVEGFLPTRHVRMQRWKDKGDQFNGGRRMYGGEFAGWGS